MTHPSVLFVAQGKKCFIYHNIKWRPTILELATTLKYSGAKWLPKKKLILCPVATLLLPLDGMLAHLRVTPAVCHCWYPLKRLGKESDNVEQSSLSKKTIP